MSEWWTYRPGDFLMFSARAYARLVERYNADVWPWQVLATLLGLGALGLVLWSHAQARHRIVSALLAGCWLWVGWAFFDRRFASINWAAEYLAWAFTVQALALLWVGVLRGRLVYRVEATPGDVAAIALAGFAVAGYPALALLPGTPVLQGQAFGVMPDPTAIATLGLLLLARPARPGLMLIPAVYCLLSGAMLLTMNANEGGLPLAAAGLAAGLACRRCRGAG